MVGCIRTERLVLRQWREDDIPRFAEICADPDVMAYFPNVLNATESQVLATDLQRLIAQRGWGFWAVDVASCKRFIGFVGLHETQQAVPFQPCVEVGWRLAKSAWGNGYAQEAARAALSFAFANLNIKEVVSFTALTNQRSIAVMQALGMRDSQRNFLHPAIPASHPLSEHVLYKMTRENWQNLTKDSGLLGPTT